MFLYVFFGTTFSSFRSYVREGSLFAKYFQNTFTLENFVAIYFVIDATRSVTGKQGLKTS